MPKVRKREFEAKRDELFADVYTATKSPQKAMIAAEPALAERKDYAKVKAQRMLKKPDIQAKITHKLERMSNKSLKQIEKMITSENEQVSLANNWKIVEHIRGKPLARNVSLSATASVEDVLANLE